MQKKKLKQFPSLRTDEEAEDFVANCDLTEYDLSGGHRVHFILEKEDEALDMHSPAPLAGEIPLRAKERTAPHRRSIHSSRLKHAVHKAA